MNPNQRYGEIVKSLDLDRDSDLKAAKILDELIISGGIPTDLSNLEGMIKHKKALIFGAGPSLTDDIRGIKNHNFHNSDEYIFIAADGAAGALLKEDILPDIHITDLDSDPDLILNVNHRGALTVVHAHGDNIPLLREIVPKLKNPIGTTQTKPFGNLHNFGGFTDGDRCVFLADWFGAKLIVLAGMDFGCEIGEYSGEYQREFKLRKLEVGKRLLEELAGESKSVMLNLTSGGEDIRNVARVSAGQLGVYGGFGT